MLGWIGVAWAGDVWFALEAQTREGRAVLDLPAAALDETRELVAVDGERVDVAALIRELQAQPEGISRKVRTIEGEFVFTHRQTNMAAPVTRLQVAALGPKGKTIELVLPLDGSALGTATNDRGVRVEGVSLAFNGEDVAGAIQRAPPRVLIDAIGPNGGRVTVASR